MEYKSRFALSVLASLALSLPVLAQSQLSNNQPIQGDLHARACGIQSKLDADYKAGAIDSSELAEYQRDLDGILSKESDYKTRNNGFTSGGRDHLMSRLNVMESRLDKNVLRTVKQQTANTTRVYTTTY